MRVCLISVEIFAWGKYGGFGRATRTIGRELVARGVEVFAVVPMRAGQQAVEDLDGIKVLGFSPRNPWAAAELFKVCSADIYHSCEPSLGSYLAMRAMPDRKHVVTCRDPRVLYDWWLEFTRPSLNRLQVAHNYLYESGPLVRKCMRRMNAVFTTAPSLIPKVERLYRLPTRPSFLPTPVAIPEHPRKADAPTVCYLARLDRRKRPELFLQLASRFPHVRFITVGSSRDPRWEAQLTARYGSARNLRMLGFVDQFSDERHARTLDKSWIVVNTATREGLPNAFLEAAAHRCAILSHVDTEGFASEFGFHVQNNDFAGGLHWLLDNDRWRELGKRAHHYVERTFSIDRAVDRHVEAYEDILAERPRLSGARRTRRRGDRPRIASGSLP